MNDERVSYEEAVKAIRRFGYAGVEREEEVEFLYADDIPFTAIKKKSNPPLAIENCTTIEDIVGCFENGGCTLTDARTWCFLNDAPQYEPSKQIPEPRNYPAEFTGVYNTKPQKKEPWPYRLVAFLNRCLEILLNSILEDFE